MNATFWVISLLLVLVCIGIVLPSILRKPKFGAEDLRVQNILIAKEKLKELEVELKIEKITQEIYDVRKQELETALINDTEANDIVVGECEHSTNAAWVVAITTPVLAVVLYLILGTAPELLNNRGIASNQATQQEKLSPQQMATRLVEDLKQEPNNVESWTMLGHTYMELQRYQEASKAFEQSNNLAPNNPQVMFRYADALAMANNRSMEGKAIELIEAALKIAPNDTTGLWLSGLYAEDHNDFEKALSQWTKLYNKLKGGQYEQKIMEMLTRVNSKVAAAKQIDLAALGNVKTESEQPIAVAGNSIEVTIAIDPALSAKVSPEDTVFIYAKAMSGPPMPLAAIKKKIKDLPITVTLDDSMAMIPNMKLSSFPNVKVGARISKSGNAITQPGDIKQEVANVTTASNQSVSLLIGAAANTSTVSSKSGQVSKPKESASKSGGIKLKVSLDPSLANQVSASDTVFIYAKAMSGPPMPLAVVKRSVKDLPVYIELDDSMAMMDELKLSAFKTVKISARISKSGDATSKDGDLYNELLNVSSTEQEPITIVINKVKGGMVKTGSSQSSAQALKTAAATGAASIQVKVTLDPALTSQAKPNDTIFIYAKAMQGPPMPLAVVRKQVKDLPLTITLDDSNAMMPAMSLSKFAKVRVGARISKSGRPIASSGDLFNEIADVANDRTDLLLININQTKP